MYGHDKDDCDSLPSLVEPPRRHSHVLFVRFSQCCSYLQPRSQRLQRHISGSLDIVEKETQSNLIPHVGKALVRARGPPPTEFCSRASATQMFSLIDLRHPIRDTIYPASSTLDFETEQHGERIDISTSKAGEIRLMVLLPGIGQDRINTRLVSTKLQREGMPVAAAYEALSYQWGPPLPANMITVDGSIVLIRHNLYLALIALRDRQFP